MDTEEEPESGRSFGARGMRFKASMQPYLYERQRYDELIDFRAALSSKDLDTRLEDFRASSSLERVDRYTRVGTVRPEKSLLLQKRAAEQEGAAEEANIDRTENEQAHCSSRATNLKLPTMLL